MNEIERKFLIDKIPAGLKIVSKELIKQGYLVIVKNKVEIRIRKKGSKHYLTVKKGSSDVKRNEIEITISKTQFNKLWGITKGKRIQKTRLTTKVNNYKVEIDVFNNLKLKIAEVEFKSISESKKFTPPSWFGKEITGIKKYYNQNLAK